MRDDKSFDDVIHAIHEALGKAERLLPRLGGDLQFLVGSSGGLEVVRRSRQGETLRPKVVISELKGCDPMLWRPEHRVLLREPKPTTTSPKEGGGQPPAASEKEAENTASKPPAGTGGSH